MNIGFFCARAIFAGMIKSQALAGFPVFLCKSAKPSSQEIINAIQTSIFQRTKNKKCLHLFLSPISGAELHNVRRFYMVAKVRLKFRLLSINRIASDRLLTLNLKNVGSNILKNLVVELHSPDPRFSVDCAGCFVYSLMPNADQNVRFRVFAPSLARAYISVGGYASGDAYFSIESPVRMAIQTEDAIEKRMLL